MICPKCKCEYIEGIKVCADCEVDLVEEALDNGEKFMEYEYVELVTVARTSEHFLIPLAKSVLDSFNIRYFIKGENVYNFLSVVAPYEIQVPTEDVETAKELLKDIGL
jgi:hypothetical protein